ncbi:C39 family peptidase [Lysinibacillus sp. NPDC096418]|uniref:C39 family peptidase n=1 Tax=Lysinibacillus sp. NPDC096418 TaxID=3364138 RepID=UPI0037FD39D7
MFRKTVAMSLLVGLLSSGVAINNASADSDVIGPSGDSMDDVYIPLEEQRQNLLKDATSKEDEIRINERFDEHEALVKRIESGISLFGSNTESGSHSVPYFKQAYSYYCGPATVKQTLQFINGSSNTQDTIASGIGTTTDGSNLANMVTYINKNQSKHSYMVHSSPDEDLIRGIPEYAVRNGSPAILRLKIAKGGNWTYTSSGHYMNMSGYSNYGKSIRVTDPYIGWVNASSTGSYWVTSNEIYTATNNHFAKQIAY